MKATKWLSHKFLSSKAVRLLFFQATLFLRQLAGLKPNAPRGLKAERRRKPAPGHRGNEQRKTFVSPPVAAVVAAQNPPVSRHGMRELMCRLIPSAMILASTSLLPACGFSASPHQPAVADVYAAGYTASAATIVPTYWKNGVPGVLMGSGSGQANAIFVSGTGIYAAGFDSVSGPVYWKNGQLIALSGGTCSSCPTWANAIFVSGSDVYVAGQQLLPQASWMAVYWKNGTLIPLTDGTQSANAQSIFVSGGDVYVAGWENKTIPTGPNTSYNGTFSKYWKNGTPVDLSDGMYGGAAYSVFVSGSDVYGAGNSCDALQGECIASLWKNGIRTELSSPSNSNASSIVVSGSDVYACGTLHNPDANSDAAVYWKNGVAVPLTDGTTQASANQIAVSGSDVYVGGAKSDSQGTFALYWKNGTPVLLPGAQPATVSSITVVTR